MAFYRESMSASLHPGPFFESSLLLQEKLIGLPLVEKILTWRHTGFNVHSQVEEGIFLRASVAAFC
jgi:hypothetical protein